VPGPSSMIGPGFAGSTACAIALAKAAPDGMTAPKSCGLPSQVLRNRTLSTKRCFGFDGDALAGADWFARAVIPVN
jgi:hypothetical protein